jgi:hypothetical protein
MKTSIPVLFWAFSSGCAADAMLAPGATGDNPADPAETVAADDDGAAVQEGTYGVPVGDTGDAADGDTDSIESIVYAGTIWLELFTEAGNDRCEGAAELDATGERTPEGAASNIACQVFEMPFEPTGTILLDPTTCTGTFAWSGVEVPFTGECSATRVSGTLDATWIDGWIEEWDRNATLCGAFEVNAP